MRIQTFSFLLGVGLLGLGCSNALQMETVRWSGGNETPARPAGLNLKEPALALGNKSLIFQTQKIAGVEVEGSYYKEIVANGSADLVAYRWFPSVPMKLRTDLLFMKSRTSGIEEPFFKRYPFFEKKDLVEKPVLVVRNGEPVWKFVFLKNQSSLEGIYVGRELQILEQQALGSHLEAPSATLFPEGPLKSSLQKVLLEELKGSRVLVSDKIKVITQSPVTAVADHLQFLYPVEDRRFEQVQVFFYLSKMLQWCEQTFQFKLPFLLEAETSLGFPEKTNAAFYFQQKIRLGEGDDKVFSDLALDPSIVVHESFHAVIEAVARLPYEGEGGSLNEGFADILTALMLENPKLGEASYKPSAFRRSVENNLSLSEKNGGLYHDSGIVSGLLWSLQKSLGRETGTQVIWETLGRLHPASDFADFKMSLKEVLEKLSEKDQLKAQAVLQNRGWSE